MKNYQLSAKDLAAFFEKVLSNNLRLIAPIKVKQNESQNVTKLKNKAHILFREIPSKDDLKNIVIDAYTDMSAKEIFFPRSEPVIEYTNKKSGVVIKDIDPQAKETVLFGARPCDAFGFSLLERLFSWDYDDPFFLKRREKTTVISLGCTSPLESCFCTSVGLSPMNTEGSDILFTPMSNNNNDKEDRYLVEVITPRGEKLIESIIGISSDLKNIFTEGNSLVQAKAAFENKVKEQMKRKEDFKDITEILKYKFDDSQLESETYRCLGCGVCSMVCPTCHCFDIVDEGEASHGYRMKNWDSCSFALFTKHGGGHNPRDMQFKRCRQRYMHKLHYYREKFADALCVGCGRCVKACPVNLDIYSVVYNLKKAYANNKNKEDKEK
ncbi:MAG: 4Fe-4S dicluster domain-containing protein [Oligoflexia bacterium]|nr:4Fe-4S dicluster domain-containing protein [Oligoflexia bacterium]